MKEPQDRRAKRHRRDYGRRCKKILGPLAEVDAWLERLWKLKKPMDYSSAVPGNRGA